jgi:hypothetical protein
MSTPKGHFNYVILEFKEKAKETFRELQEWK